MHDEDEDDDDLSSLPDLVSDEELEEDEEYKQLEEADPSLEIDETNKIPAHLASVVSGRGKYYLTNQDLLPAVIEAKEKGYMTDKLAKMLMLLTDGIARKSSYNGYSYKDDFKSEALINLVKNALKFNPAKSQNPFAYYTTAIERSFLQYIAEEKKENYIRDKMLVDAGKDPSHNFENNPITRKLKAKQRAKAEKLSKKAEKVPKKKKLEK